MIISKHGREWIVHRDGRVERVAFTDRRGTHHPRRMMAQMITKDGYLRIYGAVDNRRFGMLVHRLLAECFIPPVAGADQVNHKDGNKTNNALDNLEWVTPQGNSRHAVGMGLTVPPSSGPGELSRAAKLTAAQVAVIKRRLLNGEQYRKIAPDYGVSAGTIAHIKYRKTWVEVQPA